MICYDRRSCYNMVISTNKSVDTKLDDALDMILETRRESELLPLEIINGSTYKFDLTMPFSISAL
jgi:hypothetical protein